MSRAFEHERTPGVQQVAWPKQRLLLLGRGELDPAHLLSANEVMREQLAHVDDPHPSPVVLLGLVHTIPQRHRHQVREADLVPHGYAHAFSTIAATLVAIWACRTNASALSASSSSFNSPNRSAKSNSSGARAPTPTYRPGL